MMYEPGESDAPLEAGQETGSPSGQQESSSETSEREARLEKKLTDMGRNNEALLNQLAELKGRLDERDALSQRQSEAEEKEAKNEEIAGLMETLFASEDAATSAEALEKILSLHGNRVAEGVRKEMEAEFAPRLQKTEVTNLRGTVEHLLRREGAPPDLADPSSSFFSFMQKEVGSNKVLAGAFNSGDYEDAVEYVYKRYVDQFGDPSKTQSDKMEARREAAALESGPSSPSPPPNIQAILEDEGIQDMADIYKSLEDKGVFAEMERNSQG